MKNAGITFDITTESEAKRYLENSTYYFKLKAYAKNYDKYVNTEKKGQYINLDFAHLTDLSEIDAHLRGVIMKMTLDIEHYLKVKMLSDFQKVDEDGYEIVYELLSMQPSITDDIETRSNTSTCNEIIAKYGDNWAIWNIVEVISIGQFLNLYGLFYTRNKFEESYVNMLLPIKMIRNAAAHGNCLINRLRPPYSRSITPSYELKYELSQHIKIPQRISEKKLAHPAIHDFAVLLYIYSRIVPKPVQLGIYGEINDLFRNRMLKHKNYYIKNQVLTSNYEFIAKIVEYYCNPIDI
jgi:hypothetical protein